MLRQGTSWYALDKTDFSNFTSTPITRVRDLILYFRMANELNITQAFRKMTLGLPANHSNSSNSSKNIKRDSMGIAKIIIIEKQHSIHGSEDLQPTRIFHETS